MKIQICSDLHLEFSANQKYLKANPLVPKGDILLIAGDTYYLNRSFHKLHFIKQVSEAFDHVYLIPGNHEYYEGYDISTAMESSSIQIKENVSLVNNLALDLGGFRFIFSTFWSLIEKNVSQVYRGLTDFRRIKFKNGDLSIEQYNALHEKAFAFVEEAVKTDLPTVVLSHHLPSHLCNVDEFKGSTINEAFFVEKTDFILKNNIKYWIYGHSHRNKSDFQIGNTQMLTNQLGYVAWEEHHDFDFQKVIELSKS